MTEERNIKFPTKEDAENPEGYIPEERVERPIMKTRDEKRAIREARLRDVRERRKRRLQARELKLRDKQLRKQYYRSYLPSMPDFGGGSNPRKSLTNRMKKLQHAYDNIGKKEYKFDLDSNIGGLGHKSFTLKEPKLRTYELGSKDLNLSFGDPRFDNKTKRRKKYNKKRKYKGGKDMRRRRYRYRRKRRR